MIFAKELECLNYLPDGKQYANRCSLLVLMSKKVVDTEEKQGQLLLFRQTQAAYTEFFNILIISSLYQLCPHTFLKTYPKSPTVVWSIPIPVSREWLIGSDIEKRTEKHIQNSFQCTFSIALRQQAGHTSFLCF